MKTLMIGLLMLGLTTQVYAQNPEIFSAVYIVHNYKYLSDVNSKEVAMPVEKIHLKVRIGHMSSYMNRSRGT